MANWRYTLVEGKALRKLIQDSEDQKVVLKQLVKCYEIIQRNSPASDKDFINDYKEEIEKELDNSDLNEEITRSLLSEFYCFCDGMHIFVSL
jgi:hypothetical protein